MSKLVYKSVNGHYELHIDGKFFCSGDTYNECLNDYLKSKNKEEEKVAIAHDRIQSALKSFLEKMKAMDAAIPEELAEDALELAEEVKDACVSEMEDENPDVLEITRDEDSDTSEKMEDAMTRVLMKHGIIKDTSMKSLDELEEEIKAKSSDKSSENTFDADNEEAVERDPTSVGDSALLIIRSMKRDMAKIKDAGLRKRLSDNLARTLRMQTTDQYASVFNAAKSSASDGAAKLAAKKVVDSDFDFGMSVAKRFNPNYKEV